MKLKLLVLWAICTLTLPFLSVAMLLQSTLGSSTRALSMAISIDECANSLLGGDARETISRRAGIAQVANKSWAKVAVPIIDFFFGKGHCASNVTKEVS